MKVEPALFISHLELHGIYAPEPEFQFQFDRQWRFDFAWPAVSLALEIDGGIWIRGRHTRAISMLKTWEKENEAAIFGWRILRCQPKFAMSSEIITLLKRALPHRYTNMPIQFYEKLS